MKMMADLIGAQAPKTNQNLDWEIEVILRLGRAISLEPPKRCSEMECQDCGGREGYTCRNYGKKAWFCGNTKCLEIDCEITKKRDRGLRRHIF